MLSVSPQSVGALEGTLSVLDLKTTEGEFAKEIRHATDTQNHVVRSRRRSSGRPSWEAPLYFPSTCNSAPDAASPTPKREPSPSLRAPRFRPMLGPDAASDSGCVRAV